MGSNPTVPSMINTKSTLFDAIDIKKLENAYKAKYVCETCIKVNNAWTDNPIAIFYATEPHPKGSNYLGIYYHKGLLMITNAITATETTIVGIKANNGEIIYSRCRHDYRESSDGSVFIDGGRDYTRHGGGELVELKIINGELCNVSG